MSVCVAIDVFGAGVFFCTHGDASDLCETLPVKEHRVARRRQTCFLPPLFSVFQSFWSHATVAFFFNCGEQRTAFPLCWFRCIFRRKKYLAWRKLAQTITGCARRLNMQL